MQLGLTSLVQWSVVLLESMLLNMLRRRQHLVWVAVQAALLVVTPDAAPTVRRLLESGADLPQPTEELLNRQVAGLNLIEVDILLEPGERSLTAIEARRWCNATVPYRLSSAYTAAHRKLFSAAFEDFAALGIEFVEWSGEQNYLVIQENYVACYSYVGNIGRGGQVVNIHPNCFSSPTNGGVIHHELMHALGFYHEHSRHDRDQYVTILYDNIQDGKERNFQRAVGSLTQNTTYDYDSVLHYGATAFSKEDGLITIQTKGNEHIGQRLGLSKIDKQELKMAYSLEAQQRWAETCTENPILHPPDPPPGGGGTSFDRTNSVSSTLDGLPGTALFF